MAGPMGVAGINLRRLTLQSDRSFHADELFGKRGLKAPALAAASSVLLAGKRIPAALASADKVYHRCSVQVSGHWLLIAPLQCSQYGHGLAAEAS